jgi:hypothetical protein
MTTGPDFSRALWRTSSRTGSSNGGGGANCVEVAFAADTAALRDSKNRTGGHLTVDLAAYDSFLAKVKNGAYDLS